MSKIGFDLGGSTATEEETEVDQRIAPRWKIILHNDDHHSFEFVIMMIMEIFKKTTEQAFVHTLEIHEHDTSVLTTCSKERGQLYLEQVSTKHERRGDTDLGPLNCSLEPDE